MSHNEVFLLLVAFVTAMREDTNTPSLPTLTWGYTNRRTGHPVFFDPVGYHQLNRIQFMLWPLPVPPVPQQVITVPGKKKTLHQTQTKIEHLLTAMVWKEFSTSYEAHGADT